MMNTEKMNVEKRACLDLLTQSGPHRGRFAIIPHEVLLNVWGLSPSARDVLVALVTLDRGQPTLKVGIRTLARIAHRSRNTVSEAVKELERVGLVLVRRATLARGNAQDRSEYDLRPLWARVVDWRTVVTNPKARATEESTFRMLGIDKEELQ